MQRKYPIHCNEFIDANVFRLASEKLKYGEHLAKEKLKLQKEKEREREFNGTVNGTVYNKKEELTSTDQIISKIKGNIDKDPMFEPPRMKTYHNKSKSYNPNPFIKYEYTHPGKFIKFDFEKHEAWSCCLNDDKNHVVSLSFLNV